MAPQHWAAIFDLDGTMVANRDFHQRAWIEVCARHGRTINTDDYHRLIHARTNDVIMNNLFGLSITPDNSKQIAHEKETAYRTLYRDFVSEISGLSSLLALLRNARIPCAVASNSPIGNVDLVLTGLAVKHCFQAVITADDVIRGKPDPEIFLVAAKKLGVGLDDCVIFEDSPAGFEAARRTRAAFIAITDGNQGVDPREMAGAAAVCRNFSDLNLDRIVELLQRHKRDSR